MTHGTVFTTLPFLLTQKLVGFLGFKKRIFQSFKNTIQYKSIDMSRLIQLILYQMKYIKNNSNKTFTPYNIKGKQQEINIKSHIHVESQAALRLHYAGKVWQKQALAYWLVRKLQKMKCYEYDTLDCIYNQFSFNLQMDLKSLGRQKAIFY